MRSQAAPGAEREAVVFLGAVLRVPGFLRGNVDARDGESGLRAAQSQTPDLVILDVMLPRMDGYKVCRALKFDDRYRHIPVVILSARSGETDRRLAMELGADVYVTKPYDMKDLVRVDGFTGATPNIVFEDADIDNAVKGAISGIFAATGQTCVAGSRLLLHERIHNQFMDKLVAMGARIIEGANLTLEAVRLLGSLREDTGRLHAITEQIILLEEDTDGLNHAGIKALFEQFKRVLTFAVSDAELAKRNALLVGGPSGEGPKYSEDDIKKIEVELPTHYVQKVEINTRLDKIDSVLERIFDRLDNKVDK